MEGAAIEALFVLSFVSISSLMLNLSIVKDIIQGCLGNVLHNILCSNFMCYKQHRGTNLLYPRALCCESIKILISKIFATG